MLFRNRGDAGRALGEILLAYVGRPNVLVLGLPRGGIPVAFEVARRLDAPLDVFVVRKLGVPGHEELAMGAIASGGVRIINQQVVNALGLTKETLDRVAEAEQSELERREQAYRGSRPPLDVRGATVILVDDGLATGSTMRAAVAAIRLLKPRSSHGGTRTRSPHGGPARIVVAVPVAALSTRDELGREVDEIVCVATPDPFLAVGRFYDDFAQTTDAEVHDLLERAARRG